MGSRPYSGSSSVCADEFRADVTCRIDAEGREAFTFRFYDGEGRCRQFSNFDERYESLLQGAVAEARARARANSGQAAKENGRAFPANGGSTSLQASDAQREEFERALPILEPMAARWFQEQYPEAREESVAEAIAICYREYLRCYKRGVPKTPHQIIGNACRQVRTGRTVNSSGTANIRRERAMGRVTLDDYCDPRWDDLSEIVALRLDVPAWLASLPETLHRTAEMLIYADPNTHGKDIAQKLGVSSGRLSQRRRLLKESWDRYTA